MGSRCISSKCGNNVERVNSLAKQPSIQNSPEQVLTKTNTKKAKGDDEPFLMKIYSFSFTLVRQKIKKLLDPNIKSYITCPICETNIDNVRIIPKNLPCGHTLCLVCIEDIKRKAESSYRCPFDRQEIETQAVLPTSSYLLEIVGAFNDKKKESSRNIMKNQMKVRNIAYGSMRSILYGRNYKQSHVKKYLEYLASDIKDKIKTIDEENYLNFSIVLFLFQKEVNYVARGTSFNYFKDEVHVTESYEDNQWKCIAFIYLYNSINQKDTEKIDIVEGRNSLSNIESKVSLIQKHCTRELEKIFSNKNSLEDITEDRLILSDILDQLKSHVAADLNSNFSFSIDCLISNTNAEESGRFSGFFKKNEILRIPIKHKTGSLNCLVNISCFKTD